jgi:hypothetical protein
MAAPLDLSSTQVPVGFSEVGPRWAVLAGLVGPPRIHPLGVAAVKDGCHGSPASTPLRLDGSR